MSGGTHFCTIIARNYLPQARVLCRSVKSCHPEAECHVLLLDDLDRTFGVDNEPFHLSRFEDLAVEVPAFRAMAFAYQVVELATAVKPYFLRHLLESTGAERLVYLDPDMLVLAPMDSVWNSLAASPVVLTPHILKPIPDDGRSPSEREIVASGVHNLGFIALRRGAEAAELLTWWAARLRDQCRLRIDLGLFVDQRWMDLGAVLFPAIARLRDPGCNAAFWNLHERPLSEQADGSFNAGGARLVFFHFSGFDPARPETLSRHQNRHEVATGSPLAKLLSHYSALVLASGHESAARTPYAYDRWDIGVPIPPFVREMFWRLGPRQAEFVEPHAARGERSFFSWLLTGSPISLPPLLKEFWRLREDLRYAFPEPEGANRSAMLRWCAEKGWKDFQMDPIFGQLLEVIADSDGANA